MIDRWSKQFKDWAAKSVSITLTKTSTSTHTPRPHHPHGTLTEYKVLSRMEEGAADIVVMAPARVHLPSFGIYRICTCNV